MSPRIALQFVGRSQTSEVSQLVTHRLTSDQTSEVFERSVERLSSLAGLGPTAVAGPSDKSLGYCHAVPAGTQRLNRKG